MPDMFIVAFLNMDDVDFMKLTIGPYATEEEAEQARLAFIRDKVEEWSEVWEGCVLPVVPYAEAIRQLT